MVTAQAPIQQQLLAAHPRDQPVFVEGLFKVWLRKKAVYYCVLKADAIEDAAARKRREEKNQQEEEEG